jgi:N-acetylmuramoyl-L-alanine amidase
MTYGNQAVAVVATGALNVRSGPGVTYGSIAVIYQGQSVTVLGRHASNGWVKIRLNSGHEGWVNSNYTFLSIPLNSLPVLATDPTPQPPTPEPPIATADAIVATGALNLRSGPGISFGVVTVVHQGQPLQVLGRNAAGSWVLVKTGGGAQGWANASYLIINVPINSIPVVAEPTTPQAVGTVTTGALNIRSGPSPVYSVVAVVPGGTALTLMGRNAAGTWVKVRTNAGVEGWVNEYYLQTNVPVYTLPIIGVDTPPTPAASVAVGALNVRTGPGTYFPSFTVVYRGTLLGLMGRNAQSTWVMVRLPNAAVGWVNANLVQSNVAVSTLPITG